MLRTKIVQNYYERVGDFDKINNSYAGKILGEGQDPYELLGYTSMQYKGKTLTAKDVHDLRIAVLKQDTDTIKKLTGVDSVEKISSHLALKGMMPSVFGSTEINVPVALQKYVNILATYYSKSRSFVIFKDNYVMLKDVIAFMRLNPSHAKADLKTLMKDNKGVLLPIERGTCDQPAAYGRKLYVTKGLSSKQITQMHEKALQKAVFGVCKLPDVLLKDPLNLFIIGLTDTDVYLKMLETAEVNGMTCAQFLREMNFHTPNCEEMHKHLGLLVAMIGKDAVVLRTDDSGKGFISYTTDVMAKQMCAGLA